MGSRSKIEKEKLDVKSMVKEAVNEIFAEEHFIEIIAQKIIGKVTEKLNEYENKIKAFEEKLANLELKIENTQQIEKNNNICLYGIQENTNKNLKLIVHEQITEKMHIELTTEDIEMCYRIGKKHDKPQKGRPVIVKFKNNSVKHSILKNCNRLKGSNLFATEDLIKSRLKILREAQQKIGEKRVWPYNGCIFVKFEGKNIKINSSEDIYKYTST